MSARDSDRARVIGIDPAVAKPCAVAWWGNAQGFDGIRRKNKGHQVALLDIECVGRIISNLTPVGEEKEYGNGPVLVVCEGAYLGKNVKVYGDLCRAIGRIEEAAHRYGLAFHVVPNDEWTDVLTVSGVKPQGRIARKAAAKWCARQLTGLTVKELGGEDACDAIMIAEWAACNADRILEEVKRC